jgi:hypothetical protein
MTHLYKRVAAVYGIHDKQQIRLITISFCE